MKERDESRKEYRKPQLTEYGSITELTQAGEPGVGDSVLIDTSSKTST